MKVDVATSKPLASLLWWIKRESICK